MNEVDHRPVGVKLH